MSPLPTGDRIDADGWTSSPDGRGTFTIITSCLFTIIACCWTSVSPNLPALNEDKWAQFCDKFHVASIGILGPEFLLLLAQGQRSSARRSVKAFRSLELKNKPEWQHIPEWTLTHAFFADMGGFVLLTPDLDYPIPLDARQLYILVQKGYLDPPNYNKEDIVDKSKADRFARLLTAIQTSWFLMNTIARFAQGLAVTTLELTTLSFVVVNLISMLCWLHKPSDVTRPFILRSALTLEEVCRREGHDYTLPYERTQLDFLSLDNWIVSILWKYYLRILDKLYLPLMTRRIKVRPWNRLPADTWLKGDTDLESLCGLVILVFSATFAVAWDWYFPTKTEELLWRISSVVSISFGLFQPLYFKFSEYRPLMRWYWRSPQHKTRYSSGSPNTVATRMNSIKRRTTGRLRKVSKGQHQGLEIPLRILIPSTLMCGLYTLTRIYFLAEDLVGLRSLPHSAYATVNWASYVPHLASS